MMMDQMTISLATCQVWEPSTIQEAITLKGQFQDEASYIAGGSLLQLQWESGSKRADKHLISLKNIKELQGIQLEFDDEKEVLSIGSLTSLATLRRHPIVKHEMACMSDAVQHIGSPSVRNLGTIGGNIFGKIGDLIPLLLVLDSELILHSNSSCQKETIKNWHQRKENREADLLSRIKIPIMSNKPQYFYKKIGRREAFIPATVTVAGCTACNQKDEITHVRLAVGGGENNPTRLEMTENILKGTKKTEIDWNKVYKTILLEFPAIQDAYVSAAYRKKVAANLMISQLQEIK